jgi:hypothetical protein
MQPERIVKKRRGSRGVSALIILALALIVAGAPVPVPAQSAFEQRVDLRASSLIPTELLKSNLYTVDETVVNDGLLNHYRVRSIYGEFRVVSTPSLIQLLHEIQAIALMKQVETSDTVKSSVVQSGKNAADAVAALVTNPQETLEGAAAGVGNLFYRATQVVGRRSETAAEDSKVEQFIGKSKSKGQIAIRYGVNVYSTNALLQEELDRLGWADYLGGIGVGMAQSAIPGVGGLLLTTSGTTRLLNEVINTTPASELWVRNRDKLVAMGVNPDTVELYLNNPAFSPALETIMVEALEKLAGTANRELFIKISLQAYTHEMARTITMMSTMVAGYHQNVEPLKDFSPFARVLSSTTASGAKVLIIPADHILWTELVADAATWLDQGHADKTQRVKKQIWILGDFSARAETELQASWMGTPSSSAQATLLNEKD